jgi:hypothetical protein
MSKSIDQIQKELEDSVKGILGEPIKVEPISLKKIKENIAETLNDMTKRSLINDASIGEVCMMWDDWNIGKKIVWFFMNKLNFGRREINQFKEWMLTLDEEERDHVKGKYWYENSPKGVVCVEFSMVPPKTVRFMRYEYDFE